MYARKYVFMYVCMYVCMHACMYVCMQVGKYVRTALYVTTCLVHGSIICRWSCGTQSYQKANDKQRLLDI